MVVVYWAASPVERPCPALPCLSCRASPRRATYLRLLRYLPPVSVKRVGAASPNVAKVPGLPLVRPPPAGRGTAGRWGLPSAPRFLPCRRQLTAWCGGIIV